MIHSARSTSPSTVMALDRSRADWRVSRAASGKRFTCELIKLPNERWEVQVSEHGGNSRRWTFSSRDSALTRATALKGRVIRDGVMK